MLIFTAFQKFPQSIWLILVAISTPTESGISDLKILTISRKLSGLSYSMMNFSRVHRDPRESGENTIISSTQKQANLPVKWWLPLSRESQESVPTPMPPLSLWCHLWRHAKPSSATQISKGLSWQLMDNISALQGARVRYLQQYKKPSISGWF